MKLLIMSFRAHNVALSCTNSTPRIPPCRMYNTFTMCTEEIAECLLIPWPNRMVENEFVNIHSRFSRTVPTRGWATPPPASGLPWWWPPSASSPSWWSWWCSRPRTEMAAPDRTSWIRPHPPCLTSMFRLTLSIPWGFKTGTIDSTILQRTA